MINNKRERVNSYDLISSFPTNVFFTEKDCYLGREQISIDPANFRKRVLEIEPRIETKKIPTKCKPRMAFYIGKRRKRQLLNIHSASAAQKKSGEVVDERKVKEHELFLKVMNA